MCMQCVQSSASLASFAGTLGAAYGARSVWIASRSGLRRWVGGDPAKRSEASGDPGVPPPGASPTSVDFSDGLDRATRTFPGARGATGQQG